MKDKNSTNFVKDYLIVSNYYVFFLFLFSLLTRYFIQDWTENLILRRLTAKITGSTCLIWN